MAIEKEQPPPYSAPAEEKQPPKPKPSLWKKIRSFFSSSSSRSSSNASTNSKKSSPRTQNASQTPGKGGWNKPATHILNKVDSRGIIVNPRQRYGPPYKYTVRVIFYPVGYQDQKARAQAAWRASLVFGSDDLELWLPKHQPWRGNLDHCWEDIITTEWEDPDRRGRRAYRRTIRLGYSESPGQVRSSWGIEIHVWNGDYKQLESLSRSTIETYITPRYAVQARALVREAGNSLEHAKVFYDKALYPKSTNDGKQSRYLEVDRPALRAVVEDNIERLIHS